MFRRRSTLQKLLLPVLTLYLFLPRYTLGAEEAQISITEYELEDYIRNPRMEERDRLRGGNPYYRQGLEIISDVDDAEIRFFEEKVGRSPMEWDNLNAGAYRVSLERTGYENIEFWVTVRSDRRTVVLVRMGEPSGTLTLFNLPPDARVVVDRVPVEGLTYKAPAGKKTIRVSAFGWETVQEVVEVLPASESEWTYKGNRTPFHLETLISRPKNLPGDDRRGFHFNWTASSGGSASVKILDSAEGIVGEIPFAVTSESGRVEWSPAEKDESLLPEGVYTLRISGTGYDGNSSETSSSFTIDNRFRREPRPSLGGLPGMVYAAGSAMLPPGIWQASTGAAINIDAGGSQYGSVPAGAAVRFSPVGRLEIAGRFNMTARDPFEETSLGFSLSGSWRMNGNSGPFTGNLALIYNHEGYASDFSKIPDSSANVILPGLALALPMEYALGNWNMVLSPNLNLSFIGEKPGEWLLSTPARLSASLGIGSYYENGRWLLGASTAMRSPDYPSGLLDWTMWSGVEGRFDLPGEASFIAGSIGLRYLDISPVLSIGIEFGVIR